MVSSFNYFKMQAWSTNMLLLLHSTFMLRVVKMLLKGEVGGSALNSHGNYIVDPGKSWNCSSEFMWEPCYKLCTDKLISYVQISKILSQK